MTSEALASSTDAQGNKRRILVVEDEEALAIGIRDAIDHAGLAVTAL